MIPRWPNGETRLSAMAVTPGASLEGKPGELKHLSTLWKEKSTEMPEVAASETGRAQTEVLVAAGL
jgi:hypothetical protein